MSKKIRIITALVILAIVVGTTVVPNSAIEIKRFYGDVNNDGYVTTEDARITLLVAAGIYEKELVGLDFKAADVDDDGVISTQDARKVLRIAAGQENEVQMEGFEFSENPREFAEAINDYRFEKDRDAVKFNLSQELCTAARLAAQEYALKTGNAFRRENGTYFYKLLDEMNISYTAADKIIIASSFDYEYAIEQILNDNQAEKALTSTNFSNIGVGAFSTDGRTFYWCIFLTR